MQTIATLKSSLQIAPLTRRPQNPSLSSNIGPSTTPESERRRLRGRNLNDAKKMVFSALQEVTSAVTA